MKSLQKSEEHYRGLFENSGTNIIIVDADGKYLMVNNNAAVNMGLSPQEIVGKSMFDFLPRETVEKYLEMNRELLKKGGRREYEDTFQFPDGKKTFLVIDECMKDENGFNHAIQSSSIDITERKLAGEALVKSEQKWASLVKTIPDYIALFDKDARYLFLNHYAEGYSEKDVIGRHCFDFIPDESKPLYIKAYDAAQKSGQPQFIEYKGYGHQGSIRQYDSYFTPIFENNEFVNMLVLARDITERRQADDALRASELRFRSLIEHGVDNISLLAADGSLLWESPATIRTLGYEQDQFKGRNILDLIHPDDLERVQLQFSEILSKPGKPVHGSLRLKHSNGSWRWVEGIGTNLLHEPSVNALVINYHDITERKEAEQALYLSQQQMRSMIQEAPICIAMFDRDMKYISASHRWVREYGRGHTDLIGKSHYEVNPGIPERWREMHQRGLAGETLNNDDDLWIHEDGTKEWLRWAVVPWHDVHGKIGGIILSAEDTTERKLTQDALKASEERYRDLVENSLSLICTHDLEGNLLSVNEAAVSLTGYSRETLLHSNLKDALAPGGEEQFAEYLRKIKAEGQARGIMKVHTAKGEFRVWAYNNTLRTEGVANPIVRGSARDITERKLAEDALRESEERLRLSLQAANQGLYDLDVQSGATFVNREYAQMLGYDADTFVETNAAWIERLHPDDLDVTLKAYTDYINGLIPEYRIEFRQKTKDGKWKWILSLGKVVEHDAQGKPLRLLGTHTDITERKHAEEALRSSKQIIEGIINSIPVRVFWKDKNLIYLGCNTIFARDAGFSDPKEIIGKDDFQMGWRNQADLYRRDDRQVIESGSSKLHTEESQTTPEGKTITLLTSKMPLLNAQGQISGVLGTYMDITERKQAEAALAQSEQAYRTLFENMPIGLYRISAQGLILDVNPALVTMLGYKDRESLIGKHIADLYVDPADDEKFRNEIKKSNILSNFVAEYRRLDGTTFWTEDYAHAVQNEAGVLLFYEGSLIDITERRKAEELVSQYASELEMRVEERTIELVSANRTKDEFLANMSHELRTPLTGILGFSEMLLEQVHGPINEKQSQAVETIYSSGEHLLGLISDILDVSKIESGKFELELQNISVNDICQSSLVFIKQLSQKKSITVEYSPSPSAASIYRGSQTPQTDPGQLAEQRREIHA